MNQGAGDEGFCSTAALPAGLAVSAHSNVIGEPSGSLDALPSSGTRAPATAD